VAGEEKGSDERTEEATAQRREDFRKKGQIAQTRELASVLLVFGILVALWLSSGYLLKQLHELFTYNYSTAIQKWDDFKGIQDAMVFSASTGAAMAFPLILLCGLMGFASSVLQVGFIRKEDALKFDLEHLNPLNGVKRIVSLKAVFEGAKAIAKIVFILSVMYLVLSKEKESLPFLSFLSVQDLLDYFGTISFRLVFALVLGISFLALLDYGFQKWELEKKMMMTKQEIKEEFKNREGDPLVKARVRRVQREMAQKRMMDDVPKADVIITNPTHIAVAIKYDATMPAPKLLAKGAELVAERIKKLAKEHSIPIIENKPLARTIFKTMKIGEVIPRDLFQAVAEVLAFVYRLKQKNPHSEAR